MVYTIAIIEDDVDVANALKDLCLSHGYQCAICHDFANVLSWLNQQHYDLILLDIHIPYLNGQTLLPMIKTTLDIPVVMITSSVDEIDEVLSMSNGADDYITKPFNPTILMLRIANILKRYLGSTMVTSYQDLSYHGDTMKLSGPNGVVELSRNEALIMQTLIKNAEKLVSRNTLMDLLWENESYINDNALNVNISRLRERLKQLDCHVGIITKKQVGYMLCTQ